MLRLVAIGIRLPVTRPTESSAVVDGKTQFGKQRKGFYVVSLKISTLRISAPYTGIVVSFEDCLSPELVFC